MRFVCTDSDRKELMEVFIEEGVTHQVRDLQSVRELGTGTYQLVAVEANLPEEKVPPGAAGGEVGARAFRLPSGRLIITDLDGNLEKIYTPPPKK
jgi:hypothetical protein